MPITPEELKLANADMKGSTNRAILFTTVNLTAEAPRLSAMLPDMQANIYTPEQFLALVRTKFTVKSFQEFLDKFQPCFFYRLVPPRETEFVADVVTDSVAEGEGETRRGGQRPCRRWLSARGSSA